MFEKEAKEYQTRKHHQRLYGNKPVVMKELNTTYKDGFKDGYNKAKEWHEYSERPKEKINALCFDISQNKFILGFYDLEADEWLRYGGYETINIDLWTKIEIPEFIKE